MIDVEIWSDFACPFCYIGKAHFEKALSGFGQPVNVTYKSFELDPSAAKSQKVSIYEVLAKKYSQSIEWAKKSNERVKQMGSDAGLSINPEKIIPTNSFDAHRLSWLAKTEGLQAKIQNELFAAYFTHGLDIADPAVLKKIGVSVGLDAKRVDEVLNSDEFADAVREDEDEASQLGVQGVPFFVINRKYGISGAQPTEVFVQALTEITKG